MNRKQRYNEDPEYREKVKAQAKKYADTHKDKIIQRNSKYREKLKELYKIDDKLREERCEYYREYNKKNNEKRREVNRKYREKMKAKKEAEKMENLCIENDGNTENVSV